MLIILAYGAAMACLAFGLGPLLLYGIFHEGSAALLLFGGILVGLAHFWNKFPDKSFRGWPPKPQRWWNNLRRALAVLLALCTVAGLVFSAVMAFYGWFHTPSGTEDATVVVLGCKIRGNSPSLMLRYRLDAAYDFLTKNPGCPVVVTGGYDEAEGSTEAAVGKNYLIARGLDADRIFEEDTSTNTRENLEHSAAVIAQNNLPTRVVVVTNSFHQWRGQEYARRAGLDVAGGVPAKTSWGLFPGYWVREMIGICKLYLLE